jgi:KDO2-lipid IV(A) lauroyltransferase
MHPAAVVTRGLVLLARPWPLGGLRAFGAVLGWLWYRAVPIRRGVARENVARALGGPPAETEAIVRGMYLNLGRSAAELLALDRVAARLEIEGMAHLQAALSAGHGAILLTAHLGNWEVLVRAAAAAGRPVHVLTKRMHRGWAEAAWRALRRDGAHLLHERGSGRRVLEALARGEVVALVLDQHDASPQALRAPFFGRLAATNTGLARVALASAAPVVPVFTHRRPDGEHHVVFGAPLAVPAPGTRGARVEALTRACLDTIEAEIRRHPEQWLWIHRRWKAEAGVTPAGASPGAPARPCDPAEARAPAATPHVPVPDARDAPRPPRD